ncbi:MAG: type IX secretion system membrane protein PorP/SprF [Bacteroidetes bacterium]|nr:type IX secretion system membrane protein PorP/SprF [Bacteroidota bacterium]
MLKRITFSMVLLLSLVCGEEAFAQDPEFTQFYANPLYLNPAFAGTSRCPRFILNYRNQWPGISGTYVTYHASYDQHIDALSGGIGLMAMNDVAGAGGILKRTWLSGIYSYQLNITREFSVKMGFQATYAQVSVDWSKLTFGDQIDPKRGFVFNTLETNYIGKRSYLDISAGMLGYSKRYFFGFAVHHLTTPDEALVAGPSPLPMKITAHAGAVIPLDIAKDAETSISPNILYMKQQDFQQILLGIYLNKGPVVGGLWYRNQDSFIALLGFQKDVFKFGYSYDLTVSKLTNITAGSHEASMTLQFACKPKKKKFRTISCPSF